MKKLLLTAAFFIALSGYAAAQTNEGTKSAQATTTEITNPASKEIVKAEKPHKISRKERKAAAALEATKSVKISIPIPGMGDDTIPKKEEE